jgi:hypothetical protein
MNVSDLKGSLQKIGMVRKTCQIYICFKIGQSIQLNKQIGDRYFEQFYELTFCDIVVQIANRFLYAWYIFASFKRLI